MLYAIADGGKSVLTTLKCNGVDVVLDSRSTAITVLNPTTLQYETTHWAKGNLIASGARGQGGLGAAKIGDPTDGGLYFQFGSLIGWKGGNQKNAANPGNGIGSPQPPFDIDGYYWDEQNAKWPGWEVDSYLWPTEMGNIPTPVITEWPTKGSITTFDRWYFSYAQTPWDQDDVITPTNIRGFDVPIAGDKGTGTFVTGRYAALGVGDPCSYYLGSDWRLPSRIDVYQLNACVSNTTPFGEFTTPMSRKGRYNSILGFFFGSSVWSLSNSLVNNIFTPTVGRRFSTNGAIRSVAGNSYIHSASVYNSLSVYILVCDSRSVHPLFLIERTTALPVRCVRL